MAKTAQFIHFHYLSKQMYFPNRTQLKKFITNLLTLEGHRVQNINYIFCNDEYLFKLNQTHLLHDTYTDIITFQFSAPQEKILADVYISIDRVKENSLVYQSSFIHELHRVIFHGALHLCGYNDKTKLQSIKMRSKEDLYLRKYFVSRET